MEKLVSRKNVLLVKDEVGKAKPNTYKIPDPPKGFGKGDKFKQAGASVITSSWQIH